MVNYVYICQIKVTLVNQKHQIPPHLQEKMSVVAGCLSLAPQLEMESIEYHRPWDWAIDNHRFCREMKETPQIKCHIYYVRSKENRSLTIACYSLRKVQDIQDIQLPQSLPTSIKWLFLFSLECDFIYKLTCMFYFIFLTWGAKIRLILSVMIYLF